MSGLLKPGGRLVLTSRTWEPVRARGSRVDVRDRVIRRQGRDGVVIYYWELEPLWEDEHHLEVAVALLATDGSVHTRSERLPSGRSGTTNSWPNLSVGLTVDASTFDPEAEEYRVVARPAEAHS